MAIEINEQNIDEMLKSATPIMIDFGAEWCGPCQALLPKIKEIETEFEGKVTICKCDVDKNENVATRFMVRNIPTLLFIKNGEVKSRLVGAQSKSNIAEQLNKLL